MKKQQEQFIFKYLENNQNQKSINVYKFAKEVLKNLYNYDTLSKGEQNKNKNKK